MGLLIDRSPNSRPAGRTQRWLRAAWPGCARATQSAATEGSHNQIWLAPDIFRRSQVYFDVYGDLLSVHSARPPDLMHWTYPVPLFFNNIPNVYTIHDLIPWRHPELTEIDHGRYAKMMMRIAALANHIVTVSEASRRDIINCLGVPASSVTNTYQPVRLAADLTDRRMKHAGHFLFCGTIEPRKNIARLIAAHHASGASVPLILAGPDGWNSAKELASGGQPICPLAEMPPDAQGGVWRTGFLDRSDLTDLMQGARAMLFPSLAEGFGLPIVEAMALGVPVMTSAGGATEEIAGGAALLVDPLNIAKIAQAVFALATDDTLCARLTANGLHRAQAFSMQSCLARLAGVYDTCLEDRH